MKPHVIIVNHLYFKYKIYKLLAPIFCKINDVFAKFIELPINNCVLAVILK